MKTDSSCFGLCICISHFEVDSKYRNWMYSKQPPDLDSVGVSFILLPGTSIFVVRESFLVILLLYMEMKSNSFSRYWKRVLNSLMWSGKDNIFRKIAEKSVSSIFNLVIIKFCHSSHNLRNLEIYEKVDLLVIVLSVIWCFTRFLKSLWRYGKICRVNWFFKSLLVIWKYRTS